MTKDSLGKNFDLQCVMTSCNEEKWLAVADRWLQSDNASNLMHEECGIETEVDDKSWSFLKARCQLLLQLYPTTKEVRILGIDIAHMNGKVVYWFTTTGIFLIERIQSRIDLIEFLSLQADLKMLEEDLIPHRRMCVLLRLAEKRILLSAIECAGQRIKK